MSALDKYLDVNVIGALMAIGIVIGLPVGLVVAHNIEKNSFPIGGVTHVESGQYEGVIFSTIHTKRAKFMVEGFFPKIKDDEVVVRYYYTGRGRLCYVNSGICGKVL